MRVMLKGNPVEIRWHGRGGQGVITASRLLAEAALKEGLFFQSLPDYGAERSGAPVAAYSRISKGPIYQRSNVELPDVVIVLDSTLIGRVGFLQGLRDGGFLIVNSPMSPASLAEKLDGQGATVCTVNATAISMDLIGRNIPNVPMLGALLRGVPLVPPETAWATIVSRFRLRFSEVMGRANLAAFDRGYKHVQVGGDE